MAVAAREKPPMVEARIAGLLYLAIIVFGLANELFVRSALIVPGDPEATATRILEADTLFRLSLVGDTVMALCDVALAVLLYVILKPVSSTLALMAMVFRLVQTAVISANLLNLQAALLMLDAGTGPAALGEGQRAALALLALELHAHGYDLALLFFGAGNLILGGLVWRAPYLPRAIGALLVAAGVVYLAGSWLLVLAPTAAPQFQPAYLVCLVAEAAFCLWLLLRGVDRGRWTAASA